MKVNCPDFWKTSCIVPLYKGRGARDEIVNYRRISLISVRPICKIMESVIKIKLMDHCILNNLISNIQHGFLSGKSTITNLLELSNDLTKERDNGNNVDVICIHFAKDFDTVPPHKQLIYK